MGPVNTITFVDENRRFVTTSDDKTIRAWDFDIPVTIKYIAEPYMHSMPAVTIHPNSECGEERFRWLFGNRDSETLDWGRKILCCSVIGQPNTGVQHGQLPAGAE